MKKGLLVLASAVLGVASSFAAVGDFYIVGGTPGWSANPDYRFTKNADGTYTYKMAESAKLGGEILIVPEAAGGALDWNAKRASNGAKLTVGNYQLWADKNGSNIVIDGELVGCTFTFNPTSNMLKVEGQAAENQYDTVYLVGDFGTGWSETNTARPLTLLEGSETVWGGTYTLTAKTTYFKMKAGANIYGTGAGDILCQSGKTEVGAMAGNAFSLPAGEYVFRYDLVKNAETGRLTVYRMPNIVPSVDGVQLPYNEARGEVTLNTMTAGDGVDVVFDLPGGVQLFYVDLYAAGGTDTEPLRRVSAADLTGMGMTAAEGNTLRLPVGRGEYCYAFLVGDEYLAGANLVYNIEKEPAEIVYDLVPYVGGTALAFDETLGAYVYTAKVNEPVRVTIEGMPEGAVLFFQDLNGGVEPMAYDLTAITPADLEAEGYVMCEGNTLLLPIETGDYAYGALYNGAIIMGNMIHFELSTDVNTGVAGIEAEGAANYFNLQGARVAQPEHGMYIRVINGKAQKVVK